MKDFETLIPLHKYLQLGGKLVAGQQLMCIEHYPCTFIKKIGKYYQVFFTSSELYSKNTKRGLYERELDVIIVVAFKSIKMDTINQNKILKNDK